MKCSNILQSKTGIFRSSPYNRAQTQNEYCDPRGYIYGGVWLLPEVAAAEISDHRQQNCGYGECDNSYRGCLLTLREFLLNAFGRRVQFVCPTFLKVYPKYQCCIESGMGARVIPM